MMHIPAHNTFSNVLKQSVKRVEAFSETKVKKLKESLEHGLGNLKHEDELDMYLASYGDIHQAKLLMAYSKMPRNVLSENKISVNLYVAVRKQPSLETADGRVIVAVQSPAIAVTAG